MKINLSLVAIILFALTQGPATASDIKPFYNESMTYHVSWKGITVGRVSLSTKVKSDTLIRAHARVSTFGALKPFYYIAGSVGSEWNYKERKSFRAFESVYQGKKFQKRFYYFRGGRIKVKKQEKDFREYGYPHTAPTKVGNEQRWVRAPGYHDLIGAFYWLRTSNIALKAGKTVRLPVLPADSKKYLILKILKRKKVKTFFGPKYVYHVRSGISNKKNVSVGSGGDMLIKTKSPIDMYITDDENKVMVKGWTKVEVAGKVQVNLVKYKQK